jgi:hypothetical protein
LVKPITGMTAPSSCLHHPLERGPDCHVALAATVP